MKNHTNISQANFLTMVVCVGVFAFSSSLVVGQTEVDNPKLESGLTKAVESDQSIFSAALNNVGSKVFGSGDEPAKSDAKGLASGAAHVNVLDGVKQIENAYEYSSWGERNPFAATGSLAFELGIGLENMLPEEIDDAASQNQVIEVVNIAIENERQPEPLEYFDTASLSYKGRFTNVLGQPVALISGPDNALYKATVGDLVGLSQSKVVQVNANEVVLVTGNIVNRIPLSVAADF